MNLSIKSRMMLTVVVGLLCLVATHVALDAYFTRSSYAGARDRLQALAVTYSKMFALSADGELMWIPALPPDPKFTLPNSGLYAAVFDGKQRVWTSPSVVGVSPPLPEKRGVELGVGLFSHGNPNITGNMHRFTLPMILGSTPSEAHVYTLMIYEDGTLTDLRVHSFTSALWIAMGVSFVFILLAQSIAARWSVRPLHTLLKELNEVRGGQRQTVSVACPQELAQVATGLNDLLTHEAEQLNTHRNSLANLAHSLKTPLAVCTSALDSDAAPDQIKNDIRTALSRMEGMVSYQLSVAARSGRLSFTPPQLIEPIATDLVQSLEKIHQDKRAYCEFEIEPHAAYAMNKGDLQELLGNLLENAFKWCKKRVLLSVSTTDHLHELKISVEDDGPGVPDERVHDILKRGVRADEHVQGHGIGLAIVGDILRAYKGSVVVERSTELGGARFVVTLPTV